MKKLLSMLAVSALVGTSASNLKPLFTSNVSQGFKSSQARNKAVSITNENNTNPFDFAKINQISNIQDIVFSVNGETMFVSTSDGVYKSTDDGINFYIIKGIPNITVTKLITDKKIMFMQVLKCFLEKQEQYINLTEQMNLKLFPEQAGALSI